MNELEKNRINNLIKLFCMIFIALLSYISYLQVFKSSHYAQHPFNRRKYMIEEKIIRGSFFDRKGTILARSPVVKSQEVIGKNF